MAIDHPHDALPPGYRLGSYEILRVLGRGGFGLTYQARRAGVAGDMVAIKELYPAASARRTSNMAVAALSGTSQDEINDSIDMFIREAHLICRLDHPNIVRGVDAFEANGTAYLVMRYVSGRNLRDSLRDPTGFQPNPQSLPLFLRPLLDALDTLHRHDLLHCDIKPDNIFLGVGHEPILIDLGSARWHVPGVGTEEPATYSHYFSAIEQVNERFGPIGPWTDIYQLSAVLYRCITGGKLPDAMDRQDPAGDPFMPLVQLPESRGYPATLISGIDHGLRLLPKHRPQSIAQWRTAMGAAIPKIKAAAKSSSPQPTSPPPPLPISNQKSAINNRQSPSDPPTPKPTQPADLLLWLAGGLLTLILLIVFLIVTQ
jgi:serine/threonine protein kinase